MTQPDDTRKPPTERQINAVDASAGGVVGIGPGARAIKVEAGATYIEHQIVQQAPLPVERDLFQVPFSRNERFVGRDDLLADLHTLLSRPQRLATGLAGMGGIGKTQLAVEYAYRYRTEFQDGIFWLTAADVGAWQAGLAVIASRLGQRVPEPDGSDAQLRLVRELMGYLNSHPRSLLVLDNIEDVGHLAGETVQGFAATGLLCGVLFTTRWRRAQTALAWLEVSVLAEPAALQLLLRRQSRLAVLEPGHPEHAAAQALCRRLGYVPLALELAGAYLDRNLRVTISNYLQRIEKEGTLAAVDATRLRPEDIPTGHEPSLSASLRQQWEALADDSARLVLQMAALMGEAEQIPRARLSLLTGLADDGEPGYPSPLDDALGALREYSLIEELTAAEIRLHPLVREFVGRQIADRVGFARAGAERLAETLWDVERLESEARRQGVDAILADLRIATGLAGEATSKVLRLEPLLRALDRDAHFLRSWDPGREPGFFLQQWRERCLEMGWQEAQRQAEASLAERRLTHLRSLWPISREDAALVRTLSGHTDSVNTVALTPDMRLVVSASADHTLKVWDLTSGRELRTLSGHADSVKAVAVTPDGLLAVSGSWDTTLKVWDLASGRELRTLTGHSGLVEALALTPDGRRAVSASTDGTLKAWDLTSGRELHTLSGHTLWVHAVAVTSDGRLAVSASADHTLKVWELASGRELRTLSGHTDLVNAVAVTPDMRLVVSASDDRTLKVWDLASGCVLRTLSGHTDNVLALAVTRNGRLVISGSRDHMLKVWDLASGRELRTLTGHTNGVSAIAIALDSLLAVSGSWDKTLKVWDLESEGELRVLSGHKESVAAVGVASDGRLVVSGSPDHTLKVWDLASGRELRTLTGHSGGVTAVAITPDGLLAVSGSWDKTLKVWDLASGRELRTLTGHTDGVRAVAIAPDGLLAVSGSWDNTLKVWDLATGRELRTLSGHKESVASVAVAPDGRLVVSASPDHTLKVWDLASGRELRTLNLTGNQSWDWTVAVTPDGRLAVSASPDCTLEVWDLTSGHKLHTLNGHANEVNAVAIAPDGRLAVSGSSDHTLKVWDLASGQLVLSFSVTPIMSLAITADGQKIVAGDAAGGAHFLSLHMYDG